MVNAVETHDEQSGRHTWPVWIACGVTIAMAYPVSLGPVWLASDFGLLPDEAANWLIFGLYGPLVEFAIDPDGGDLNDWYLYYIAWWRSFAGMG